MRTLVIAIATLFVLDAAAAENRAAPSAAKPAGPAFDRSAAASALGNVDVQSCKKPGGPTGEGQVKVTFAPNGSVSTATVETAPFAGTPVGGCVASKFRGAHVPAFAGEPVTVGKSFKIN